MLVTLTQHTEQSYLRYHGDFDRAIVHAGRVISCGTYAQLSQYYMGELDSFLGSTPDELKANGFSYAGNHTYYTDAAGHMFEYHFVGQVGIDEGVYEAFDLATETVITLAEHEVIVNQASCTEEADHADVQ